MNFSLIRQLNKKVTDFFFNHNSSWFLSVPRIIQLEPTTACPLNCVMCARHKYPFTNEYMTDAVFYKIMQYGRFADHVFIAGHGEPLLHPDVFRYMKYMKNRGMKVHLVTSGSYIPDNAVNLISQYADSCIISFDALDDSVFKEIRGISNKQVIEFIENLHNAQVVLSLNIVLMKNNRDEVEKIIKRFPYCRNILLYHPKIYTDTMKEKSLLDDWDNNRFRIWRHQLQKLSFTCDIAVNFPPEKNEKLLCIEPFEMLVFNYNGDAHGCCTGLFSNEKYNIYCGNIMKKNMIQLWNAPEIRRFRKAFLGKGNYPEVCMRCPSRITELQNYIRI